MSISKIVRHRTAPPNTVVLVSDPDRPYTANGLPTAFFCPACQRGHVYKTYHIPLDANSQCRLSDAVFEALCGLGAVDGAPMRGHLVDAGLRPADLPFEFVSDETGGAPLHVNRNNLAVFDAEGRNRGVAGKQQGILIDHPTELERMGRDPLPPRTREGVLRNG